MSKQKRDTGRPAVPIDEKIRTPMRVASRLEGVVKNAGIKEKKKEPRKK